MWRWLALVVIGIFLVVAAGLVQQPGFAIFGDGTSAPGFPSVSDRPQGQPEQGHRPTGLAFTGGVTTGPTTELREAAQSPEPRVLWEDEPSMHMGETLDVEDRASAQWRAAYDVPWEIGEELDVDDRWLFPEAVWSSEIVDIGGDIGGREFADEPAVNAGADARVAKGSNSEGANSGGWTSGPPTVRELPVDIGEELDPEDPLSAPPDVWSAEVVNIE
jgi:hypothetical protein